MLMRINNMVISVFIFMFYFSSSICGDDVSIVPGFAIRTNDSWRTNAIQILWNERRKMSHTPIVKLQHPLFPNNYILFKDETASVTQSLKHRFSWALFMWALLEGNVVQNTHVYEASSGNTAASEAYLASLIGINFTAVVSPDTTQAKLDRITKFGGNYVFSSSNVSARILADNDINGFFMDQGANAFRAEDYFDNQYNSSMETMNVFHELLAGMQAHVTSPNDPDYFVMGAGTGGTMTSVGRYIKKYVIKTQVVLADVQYSPLYDWAILGKFQGQRLPGITSGGPGIQGLGYGGTDPLQPGTTTSLQPSTLDLGVKLPDLASIAAMHVLKEILNETADPGPTTGVNFLAALHILARDPRAKIATVDNPFIITTLICDPFSAYLDQHANLTWIDIRFANWGGLNAFNCFKAGVYSAFNTGIDPFVAFADLECPAQNLLKDTTETPETQGSPALNSLELLFLSFMAISLWNAYV